jgi:hypothetical protein
VLRPAVAHQWPNRCWHASSTVAGDDLRPKAHRKAEAKSSDTVGLHGTFQNCNCHIFHNRTGVQTECTYGVCSGTSASSKLFRLRTEDTPKAAASTRPPPSIAPSTLVLPPRVRPAALAAVTRRNLACLHIEVNQETRNQGFALHGYGQVNCHTDGPARACSISSSAPRPPSESVSLCAMKSAVQRSTTLARHLATHPASGGLVRWGLAELPALLRELGVERPLLLCSQRWAECELPVDIPAERKFLGVAGHAPPASVRAAGEAAQATVADALLPLGGGVSSMLHACRTARSRHPKRSHDACFTADVSILSSPVG